MRYSTLLLSAFLFFLSPSIKGQEVDSLKFEKNLITVGETFHLDTRTNGVHRGYSLYNDRSFFKDDSGGLHTTFISNYELYYYYSSDNGENWVGEQIITGEEGNIIKAVVCADADSKPYIAFTSNPYFNYANQANGITTYYRFECSFVSKEKSAWKTETLYKNVGSYGFVVSDICIEKDGSVNVLGSRYGWYTYGGEIWEYTKKTDGTISSLKTIYKYKERNLDLMTFNAEYILYDDNTKDIVFGRSTNVNREFRDSKLLSSISTIHFDGTSWDTPKQLTTIWHNYAKSLTFDDEGNNYLLTFHKNTKKVKLSKNLGELKDLDIDLSMIFQNAWAKIHYLNDGNLYIIVYPHQYPEGTKIKNNYIYVSTDKGDTWSAPIIIDRAAYMLGAFAHTNQYNNTIPSADHIGYSRVSNENPYGPDSLFFNKAKFINKAALGLANTINVKNILSISPNPVDDILSIKYNIDSPVNLNIDIYDVSGKLILEKAYFKYSNSNDITIDTYFLKSGIYILQINDKDNKSYISKRFVKR